MTREADGRALPPDLRERVLSASLRVRAAGRPEPVPAPISAAEAFSRTADALDDLLGLLDEQQWTTPALRELDVQGLVGHLIGVEQDMQRCLAGDPGVGAADHVGSTQPAAERQAGRAPALTRAEWRRAADRTIELVRTADMGVEVALHGVRVPLSLQLTVRALELWVHENDIREAVALPPSAPDPSTVNLMVNATTAMLPQAARSAHLQESVHLHLVLTGPGGGTWDIPVGQSPAPPSAVTIVADAVGFCRLIANRTTPADLDPYITGDRASADAVLAAAGTLALD